MMDSSIVREDEAPGSRSEPSPKPEHRSHTGSLQPQAPTPEEPSPTSKKPPSQEEFILSVASKVASQPLQNSDPDVWGVLTAISANARKRRQGMHMFLSSDEHGIGRLLEDKRFRIETMAVSSLHCKIYRRKAEKQTYATLKDNSTNGTYLNFEKLKKNTHEVRLCHGDIISFAAPPHQEDAFAFVYRDVCNSTSLPDGAVKRKAEEVVSESKRLRGIGIGAPEGPISLDDFRSLQRSNTDLRKQLEDQVFTVESLRNDNRAAMERHENEMKVLKESVTKSYIDQLNKLHYLLEEKQKELVEVNKLSTEQKHVLEDLNERLTASTQSYNEINDIVNSQKASILELKAQLDEERDLRREEREKAVKDLKAAVHKAQIEAQDEIKRLSEAFSKRVKEQEEVINKLQEAEKEMSLLMETLRSKLEDTRQKIVVSENKVRQLESQVNEEKLASTNGRKRIEELEHELESSRRELESEKAAREEAWAKVSLLEIEINAAARDLDYERRRLRGAKERIMLRETQLRAFYSTTEEISSLFAKQQEQLKAMQRTLEDEENYENMSADFDLNTSPINLNINQQNQVDSSTNEENSATEKHECQENDENTQEVEFKGHNGPVMGAFGSDILGGTETLEENIDPVETERVLDTESPNKCDNLAGDTMQLDEKDTEPETIRTVDLLTSEVAGSWACDTIPSVHGENESEMSRGVDFTGGIGAVHDSNSLVAESQSTPPKGTGLDKDDERRALSEMIGIVAPELKDQFSGAVNGGFDNRRKENGSSGSSSGSDTVDVNDEDDDDDVSKVCVKSGVISDSDTMEEDDDDDNDSLG